MDILINTLNIVLPTLYAVALLLLSIQLGLFPVATVFEAFSVVAFSILVVYLLIEWQIGVRTTGFFIVGVIFAFQLVSSAFMTRPTEVNPLLTDPSFVLHV